MSVSEDFPWNQLVTTGALANNELLGEALKVESVRSYLWMVIIGGILAFAMAWGIGANDVANAFATSVGAGSLNLKWACVIAAIFEFLGATLMGGSVTDTVRKKIIQPKVFDPTQPEGAANGPELLMTGFLISLFAATFWLVLATYLSLPVSTTHSIIGALIGVGLAYRGKDAVIWISTGTGFRKLRGVVGVILSWLISPVLSGIIAVAFFFIVRTTVLRRPNPYKAGLMFMPIFYGFAVALTIFFIIYKGDKRFKISSKISVGIAVAIAFGAWVVVALISWFFIVPLAKRYVEGWEARELEKLANPEIAKAEAAKTQKVDDLLAKVGVNVTIKEELDEDVIRMHDNVEKFDPKTEQLFTWVQVFTAAFDAFAHGANDVANAIAPFASIFQLYRNNGVLSSPFDSVFEEDGVYSGGGELDGTRFEADESVPDRKNFCGNFGGKNYFNCGNLDRFPDLEATKSDAEEREFDIYDKQGNWDEDSSPFKCFTKCSNRAFVNYDSEQQGVPLWILAMGGAGIVLGLAMWGYRIIVAIGVKLTKLTPSRGFSIEIGAAITVLFASRIGLPVSTTHCQVGATMGVGLIEFKASTVNWKQFVFICIGWVFTVIFTGFVSAILFFIVTRTPLNFSVPQGELSYCPGNRLFLYDLEQDKFRGITCSGV